VISPGQLIASTYRVTGRIGQGGMGDLFRAVDEQLHRAAAIKFLSAGLDGVGDDVFKVYRAMYAYDKKPLEPEVGASADQPNWTMQKVTIDAAYGRERLPVFLFLPKNTKPPFQTVVFFPSARVNFLKDSSQLGDMAFLDGGFFQQEHPVTGMDQVDFAPRMTKPVLMVNGRFDATFPYDSSQLPMFRMLGAPAADKRHVVFDTPHDVTPRREDLIREALAWFDKYLGRVN